MIVLPLRQAVSQGESVLDGSDFLEGDREHEFNLEPLPGAPQDGDGGLRVAAAAVRP
jgi:hypothetical protein